MGIKTEVLAEKIFIKGSAVARHLMDGDVTSARIAIGELGGYLDVASNQLDRERQRQVELELSEVGG